MRWFIGLVLACLLAAGPACANQTTWTCLQRGSELTYTLNVSLRPHCTNTLTFTGVVPSNGDPVFSWTVQSTATDSTLPSWNVPPWEASQDISIIAMNMSVKSGPLCHMYVGSTFNGDNVLDKPTSLDGAVAGWIGTGAALVFPGVNDNPPSPNNAYLDLHGDNCPVGQTLVVEVNVTYLPEATITPGPCASQQASPTGSMTTAGFVPATWVDRGYSITNGVTLCTVGLYSVGPATGDLHVVQRTSAGQYTVVASQSFSHPGGGWVDFTMPVSIPATGEFHVAAYIASGTVNYAPGPRSWGSSGDWSGSVTGITEDSSVIFATRASH